MEKGMGAIREALTQSVFFGVVISLLCYQIGVLVRKKTKLAIANPLLLSVIIIIAVLLLLGIDYDSYYNGAKYIQYFLTPATVSLAVPLYRQLAYIRKYPAAVFGGIASGVLTAMGSIFLMGLAFGLTHEQYVSLLPKSITTAIGIGISEKMGGMVNVTIIAISITGILGNIVAEGVCKVFHIQESVAKGLAIGTAAHALGTTKAMELGEVEGAMSSLSIVVAGILTVITVSVFAGFL